MQVSFIFNIYMQLIIAGLKTSLHLTPFCLLELILAIIKKGKKNIYQISGFVRLLIKTLLSFDLITISLISPNVKYFTFIF